MSTVRPASRTAPCRGRRSAPRRSGFERAISSLTSGRSSRSRRAVAEAGRGILGRRNGSRRCPCDHRPGSSDGPAARSGCGLLLPPVFPFITLLPPGLPTRWANQSPIGAQGRRPRAVCRRMTGCAPSRRDAAAIGALVRGRARRRRERVERARRRVRQPRLVDRARASAVRRRRGRREPDDVAPARRAPRPHPRARAPRCVAGGDDAARVPACCGARSASSCSATTYRSRTRPGRRRPTPGSCAASARPLLWEAFAQLPERCRSLLRVLMADPPPAYEDVERGARACRSAASGRRARAASSACAGSSHVVVSARPRATLGRKRPMSDRPPHPRSIPTTTPCGELRALAADDDPCRSTSLPRRAEASRGERSMPSLPISSTTRHSCRAGDRGGARRARRAARAQARRAVALLPQRTAGVARERCLAGVLGDRAQPLERAPDQP